MNNVDRKCVHKSDNRMLPDAIKALKAKHCVSIIDTPERPYLKWLKEGVKIAEGRVNSPTYRSMVVNDTLVLYDRRTSRYIYGPITFKHEYETFRELLLMEGVQNMLPFLSENDLEKGIQVYESFPKAERVKDYGCVAIGIRVAQSNF